MAHLAPFVAAILRDGVVDDLQADNRRLRADGPTSTILVTGLDGTVLFATGRLSQREGLRGVLAGYNNPGFSIGVEVEGGGGAATCRLGAVRDCRLVLRKEEGLGPDVIQNFDALDIDEMRLHDGLLQIFFRAPGVECMFNAVRLDVPAPLEFVIHEEVGEDNHWGRNPPMFLAAYADAPVRFRWAALNAQVLLGTLAGGEGS